MIWHFFWSMGAYSIYHLFVFVQSSTFFPLQNCIFYLDESKINGVWPKIYLVTDVESTPLKVGRDCHQPVFRKQCLPCQSHYWPKFKSANCYVLSVFLKTALLGSLHWMTSWKNIPWHSCLTLPRIKNKFLFSLTGTFWRTHFSAAPTLWGMINKFPFPSVFRS